MKELKRIPKWGWITGGLAAAVVALWLWERHKAANEAVLDPCDPTNPEYKAENCPKLEEAPPGESTYGMGGATGSAAGGGMQYYYPYPSATEPTTPPAATGEPEETFNEPPTETSGGAGEPNTEIVAPVNQGTGERGRVVQNESINQAPFVTGSPINTAPSGWCGHPGAVGTGNPCVNGGVGAHTAPTGWHLFCCNGVIGRAPDVAGIGESRALPAPPPNRAAPAPVGVGAPAGGSGGGGGGGGGGSSSGGGWCGHPDAVATGNPCVNGGVGGHTAPNGYHLFCCNGMIGRAPN